MKSEQTLCGIVTAQNPSLSCTKQECKWEFGGNPLHSALCCWHHVQWEYLSLFSSRTNSSTARRSTLSSPRAPWRRQHLGEDPGNACSAWEVWRAPAEGFELCFQLICHGQHSVFVEQEEICSLEQHPSSLGVFLKCNHHQTAHLMLLLSR